MKVKDLYETRAPSSQNILDIFNGEFKTKMLSEFGLTTSPGDFNGFNDQRIFWAEKRLGSFKNKVILELGPLELAHSYMMAKMGAKKIVSIESNSKCFLRSLCIKNIFSLNNVDLLFGDFNKYMALCNKKFDFILASGVLYHMTNPVDTIKKISLLTNNVFIWTHIFDDSLLKNNKFLKESYVYEGKRYHGAKQVYQGVETNKVYCGGSAPTSFWLRKESLMQALKKYGFRNIEVASEYSSTSHVHGSCIAMFCKK